MGIPPHPPTLPTPLSRGLEQGSPSVALDERAHQPHRRGAEWLQRLVGTTEHAHS